MGFPFIIGGIKLMNSISILVNRFVQSVSFPAYGGPDLGGDSLLLHASSSQIPNSCVSALVTIRVSGIPRFRASRTRCSGRSNVVCKNRDPSDRIITDAMHCTLLWESR